MQKAYAYLHVFFIVVAVALLFWGESLHQNWSKQVDIAGGIVLIAAAVSPARNPKYLPIIFLILAVLLFLKAAATPHDEWSLHRLIASSLALLAAGISARRASAT